ncbi:DUF983 domain-containing protein [Roseibium denhamense]|uniref:Uncharacterized conserved protein, DUF983 family n=1 Tax=Roseibium denhamense TaxID=76305 RepID=A0ABY1NSZ2_9HYPH|nr:DUF983 domain-containing protein [Roseibium denhamense]MTI05363.1 DUF983 domain-containing protein [Roseibium denhamense]SMP17351.1 Uncharacterized conserved protein, DUF983 family [Roseibium denhamense]
MSVRYEIGDHPEDAGEDTAKPKRPVIPAMLRGASGRCMKCGEGRLFEGFLKVRDTCSSCGEEFHHHRADDAPPYFNMTIVGHIIVPALLIVEVMWRPAIWVHMALWIPLTLILAFGLMRPVKGALIALQWALYMHGFDPDAEDDLPVPDPALQDRR